MTDAKKTDTATLHFKGGEPKQIPFPPEQLNYGRLPPTTLRWTEPKTGAVHTFAIDTGAWSGGSLVYREVGA